MVTRNYNNRNFTNFINSREDKEATFNSVALRRAQKRLQPQPQSEKIYQPDTRYAPFQESEQYRRHQEAEAEYEAAKAEINSSSGSYREKFLRENQARVKFKQESDAAVKQYDATVQENISMDKPFIGLNGEHFNPDKDTPDSFLIRDKAPWIAKQAEMIGEGGDLDRFQLRGRDNKTLLASPTELEFLYYQQVLQKNNINLGPVRNLPTGEPDWEAKLQAAKKQAHDMLSPISFGDSQKNRVYQLNTRGYQQRNLQKDTGVKRLRNFAGLVANPLNEEFIPVTTAQAAFALPGYAAGELGIATPAASETMQKVGAGAGEWVGFGFGIGSIARSSRWIAEDIALPYKVLNGLKKFTAKKFGMQGVRKSHQVDNALSFPDQTPPSIELTPAELEQTNKSILSYARETVGGTEPEAETVEMSVREANQLFMKVVRQHEGTPYETTFQINTVDDYFNAAGSVLGMTAEHTTQAKRVAQPILESLAKMFGVSSDEYIKHLLVGVRGVEDTAEFAARTIPLGTEDAAKGIMKSVFRRTASLVEFVRAAEGQTLNQADAFATVQHELSHIILQDIFTYAKTIKDNGRQVEKLSEVLKNQIIKRQEAIGEPLDAERIQLIQSLTPEEIGNFITLEPGAFIEGMAEIPSQARALQIQQADINMLLQEAGADLFARYLVNVGAGKTTGHMRSISHELDTLFLSAAKSLGESWDILRGSLRAGESLMGIARQQTDEEMKILSNFQSVLNEVIKGTETAGPAPLAKSMTEAQRAELAKIFYRDRYDNDEVMRLARLLMADNQWQFNVNPEVIGQKMRWDLDGAAELITDTTARHTSFGQEIHRNNHFRSVLDALSVNDPDFTLIQQTLEPTMKLRLAVSEVASSPETKLLSVHDVAPNLRPFIEPVEPLPNLDQRLARSAFVNANGDPIVFFHGATVDFNRNFNHEKTNGFANYLGPALYASDFDQVGVSYAIQTHNPDLARVQAFHVLVSPERVMSAEMLGTTDPVATRFIDHSLFNGASGWQKNVTSFSNAQRKLIEKRVPDSSFFGQRWKDVDAVNIGEVFGQDSLKYLYDEFLDVFDATAREEAYFSPWKGSDELDPFLDDFDDIDDFDDFIEDQIGADESAFGQVWDTLYIEKFKGVIADFSDIRGKLVVNRASAIASRNIARTALQSSINSGASKEVIQAQRKAVDSLETQVSMLEAAADDVREIYTEMFVENLHAGFLDDSPVVSNLAANSTALIGYFDEILLESSPMANNWNVAKAMTLNNIEHPKLSGYEALSATVEDIAAQHFFTSERNRTFIRSIQDSFDGDFRPAPGVATGKQAVDRLNKVYADTDVEAITEIGGTVQGGTGHRVVAIVGPDKTIQNNRQLITYKTNKAYNRLSFRAGYVQRPDGTPSAITGNPIMDKVVDYYKVQFDTRYGATRWVAVQTAKGGKPPLLTPVKPRYTPEQRAANNRLGPGYKLPSQDHAMNQQTFEYSVSVRGQRVPRALVSIHRAEKIRPRRAKKLGVEPVGSGHWVLHTTPIKDGGKDLTLAERQEIADSLVNAPREKQLDYLPNIKSIDINTTFGEPNVGRDPARDEVRSFYRKNNPKGGDIDETVTPGEFDSNQTEFGRQLDDGVQASQEASKSAVEELADKKLIASPRAVENPAHATADIINMQQKTEVGKVVHAYHGIPRVVASNLTPAQLDYRKWFKLDGIEDTFGREDIDFVIGDTTGVYRQSDGKITRAGEEYLAEKASLHVNEVLKGEDYRRWQENSKRKISEARTKGNKIIQDAEDAHEAGKINTEELERRTKIGQKMSGSEPVGGYKPLQLHPLFIESMINTGFRRLKAIHPTHGFERADYSASIQKLIGVKTPEVGSTAAERIRWESPSLAGMAGTEQVKFAQPLTPYEVNLVYKGLGLDAGTRLPHRTKLRVLVDMFVQAMNFPRMLLLSIDAGAIWNQGGMLVGGAIKPVTTRRALSQLSKGQFREWASGPDTQFYQNLGRSVAGMVSAGNYRKQMDAIYTDPNYDFLVSKTDIFISDIDGPLANREEQFLGNVFQSIEKFVPESVKSALKIVAYPFKTGERFHNLYLNRMRYDLLNDYYKGLGNIPQDQKELAVKSYADFLNKATGRGDLGKLDNLGPELSTVLLAPRWMASRFQVPYTVAKNVGKETLNARPRSFPKTVDGLKDARHHAKSIGLDEASIVETADGYSVQGYKGAHTSKQMAQDLVRTFGVIGGIVSLLAMNDFKVETDWRKSSFLKVSKGRINIDLTMGLGSVWRFVARSAYGVTARKEVTSTGAEFDADVMRQVANFSRAKLSPLGSSAAGLMTGTNYFGEEVSGKEVFIPGQSTSYEDFLPLMVQQIKDASEQIDGGPAKALLGISAVSGLNVGIYPDKDDIARELTDTPYEDLYGYEQKYIDRMYYTGTEFQPSKYKSDVYQMEEEQYEWIETIMSGPLPNGEKASRIYYKMKEFDIKMQGVRRAYFGDQEDRQSEGPESRLKKAQADYYALMSELMGNPQNQAMLTSEEIEKREQAFLSRLGQRERDYILANKTNFMVPPSVYRLIKNEGKAAIASEERKARTRQIYIAQGREIPDSLKEGSIDELSQKYYAVARSVIESNQARERLSAGRTTIPRAEQQIDLTRVIAAR